MILNMISQKYIWVINVILIIAIAYVSARIVNDKLSKNIYHPTAVTTAPVVNNFKSSSSKKTKKHNRTYYDIILTKNIFGPRQSVSRGGGSSSSGDLKPKKTNLNLTLLGTHLKNNGGRSVAIIKNSDNDMIDSYTEGSFISIVRSEKVQLLNIENCQVSIKRVTSETEVIACDNKNFQRKNVLVSKSDSRSAPKNKKNVDGIKKLENNRWIIEKKMFDELLEDPAKLLTQARAIPEKDGLRFVSVKPGSVFFKIGLRNGDIVHTINEVKLDDMKNVWSLFEQLKDETDFIINFTRKGNRHSYSYNIN